MGLDTPLAFCLMSDKDEGIPPLALAGHMTELHNDLLQVRIIIDIRLT
jgi:hypothetical protein